MSGTNLSSDLLTADTAVLDRRGILTGVNIITDQTNDVTLIIYDNASAASGTVLFKAIVPGTEDTAYFRMPGEGVRCVNGLYADVTGTGAEFVLHYK